MTFNAKNMHYRYLGGTGLKVSAVGFGNAVNGKPDRAEIDDAIIGRCLENGINFFDTAELYDDGECEKALGRAFKKHGVNRSDIVVSTKIGNIGKSVNSTFNTNRKHILESVDACLQRLQLDHVDVIFAHIVDPTTPMEEICRAFDKVIEDGKAFYWGTSNWSAELIFDAFSVCDRLGLHRPIADQCQYNMLTREVMEVEFETLFDRHHYGTTTWSALAGGFLTGKYLDGIPADSRIGSAGETAGIMRNLFYEPHNTPENIQAIRELDVVAKEQGSNLAQLALAWVLLNPNVSTALIGAKTLAQLDDTLGGFELSKRLNPEIEKRINGILNNTPKAKFDWFRFAEGRTRRPVDQPAGQK